MKKILDLNLTTNEACDFLEVSQPTLLVRSKKFNFEKVKIKGRNFYSLNEIIEKAIGKSTYDDYTIQAIILAILLKRKYKKLSTNINQLAYFIKFHDYVDDSLHSEELKNIIPLIEKFEYNLNGAILALMKETSQKNKKQMLL